MKLELVSAENEPVLKPGQGYLFNLIDEEKIKRRCMWLACYICGAVSMTSLHTIVENPDGTITVNGFKGTRSLKCSKEGCPAHYFIDNSEIVPS